MIIMYLFVKQSIK